ncbi:MAG: DNA polymerase domain-containing protein [Steroidobacteraceae bacterium]
MPLTHPERVLYPGDGVTKAELAAWFDAVAESLLPQLADRPLSVLRIAGDRAPFFQRHLPGARGVTACDSRADLQALAQLGVVELHTAGTRRAFVACADRLTFDLDPGTGLPWGRLRDAACAVRDFLASLGLVSFAKSTGGNGLHVVVPLAAPRPRWERALGFSRAVSQHFARTAPDDYTARTGAAARQGKVFIDYLRNGRGASAVAAFSPRWRPGVPVAVPLSWHEVEMADARPRYTLRTLDAAAARERARRWSGYDGVRQSLSTSITARVSGRRPRQR